MEKDYDYYLFWAEEFLTEHYDELVLCPTLVKTQITCSHLLMDEGQEENYQEDGFMLGEIIYETFLKVVQGE